MIFSEIKEAVIVGIFLAFMIGPVFFMLIQTSILKGFRAAFMFDLGVVFGDVLFLIIAYFGSRGILLKIKEFPYLFLFGGIIMMTYGVIMFLNHKQKRIVQDEKLVIKTKSNFVQLFFNGFFLNIINVGVLGFWIGMILIYGARFKMNEKKIFWFFITVLLTYLLIDVGKILLAKKLREKMTPSIIYKLKQVMGIILIVFGLVLSLESFIPKENIPLKRVMDPHSQLDTTTTTKLTTDEE